MASEHLGFVGTYTDGESEGIYGVRVDGETGAVERCSTTPGGENPSFLAVHPSGDFLYAVNEVPDGQVSAFSIDRATGELEPLNRASTGSAGPCHLSVDATGSHVFVAHYVGGCVSAVPINPDGEVRDVTEVIEHEGTSVDPDRQTRPHPHSIVPDPANRFIYVPDLGADRVVCYSYDHTEATLIETEQGAVDVQEGAGPRHLAFHPSLEILYLLNEMGSTITTFERNRDTGSLAQIETVGTLPDSYTGTNSTAEIQVHPSGDWLYCSNRGHDSIAIFEVDGVSGRLTPIGHESTRGETPRNFALSPDGELLFALNQDSDDIHAFRVHGDGLLDHLGHVAIPSPVCLCWVF